MADEDDTGGGGGGGGGSDCPEPPKCEVCVPGLPGWMATFSDLVTLLLTFFVLLLSFAKTESAKYEAALGSIKNAFGGNVLKQGEVLQPGKSPDDSPEMIDAQEPIKPFPIDFLTMEGLLDKHEINRESEENLKDMRSVLREFELTDNIEIQEMPEGVKVRVKDKIFFSEGGVKVTGVSRGVLDKMSDLLSKNDWTLFIEGHAARGETSNSGLDAFGLSAKRAEVVARNFIRNKVRPEKITTVFYGDTRPDEAFPSAHESDRKSNRRVEFIIRKTDLRTKGHKVNSR